MRRLSARWWRQAGFWGLTVDATLGLPVLFWLMALYPDTDWGLMATVYPMVLATWAAAAGIRQWGKSNGSEAQPHEGTGV